MKIMRIFVAILIASFFIITPAEANTVLPANIELIGDAKELAFTETTEPGFAYAEKFLPGQSIERTLTIRNLKNVPFRLSYELERVSKAQNGVDLHDQLDISIYDEAQLLCSGSIDDNNCDERQFYDVLQPGDVRTLKMVVTFNKEAGNEYKNLVAQYDWIFDAIVVNVPTTGTPTTPKPVLIPTTGSPLVNTGLFALEIGALGIVLLTGGRYLMKQKKDK